MSNSYLAHHGILGQKWGVRRYQNEDGTLTAEGKVKKAKSKQREDVKNVKNMSDKDLQNYINRLQNEKRLKDLSEEDLNPGRRAVKNFMNTKGQFLVGAIAVGAGIAAIRVGSQLASEHFENKANTIAYVKNTANNVSGMVTGANAKKMRRYDTASRIFREVSSQVKGKK